jgi:hypothetical protein
MVRAKDVVVAAIAGLIGVGCTSSVNVGGTVSYGNLLAAPGLMVLITDAAGSQYSVTTDTNGAFHTSNVATPYTAAIADLRNPPTSLLPAVTVYSGLTRADPTLIQIGVTPRPSYDATIVIALTGGTYPQPDVNSTTTLAFVSPQALASASLTGAISATNSLDVQWVNSSTSSGMVYAVQVTTDSAGLPVNYPGYGATSAVVMAGATTNAMLQLHPAPTAVLAGSLAVPSGYSMIEVDGYLSGPAQPIVQLFATNMPAADFSYVTPSIAGTTLTIEAVSLGDKGELCVAAESGLAANASDVALNCPAAPTLIAPMDGETGVTTSTEFSWSSTGGTYAVAFSGGGRTVYYVTNSTSATFPTGLDSIGVGLSGDYSWQVSSTLPFRGIDVAVPPNSADPAYEGISTTQGFTTSPSP